MNNYTSKTLKGLDDIIQNGTSLSKDVFSEYDYVYPFTNECIRGYIDLIDFSKSSRALSVMGSGDHAFNLIANGLTDVDTFDINKVTEYYVLGLKRTMIMKYSYEEFLEIAKLIDYQIGYGIDVGDFTYFNKKTDIIKQLVLDLYKDMDYEYRSFWLKVIDGFNKKSNSRYLVNHLFATHCGYYSVNNNYLSSEEKYNELKSSLGRANINFVCSRIEDVPFFYDKKKYDVVLFSNILDYMLNSFGYEWNYSKFSNFNDSIEEICNDDALIFYNYLFSWRYSSVSVDMAPVFFNSSVHLHDLKDMKIVPIDYSNSTQEGIVLKKVMKG